MADNSKSIYKILDYTSGLEVVQNMEAKDTKYRGIYRLFTAIGAWADKYSTNKLLPNVEIIAREISMERDRAETFLMELCFRTLVPVIKKVTTVEYDPSTSERDENLFNILNRNTVYLRPPAMDGDSCERIIQFLNEASVTAIKRGLGGNRSPYKGLKFKDFIFSKVGQNKLNETYANWDISQLFNCQYDTTKNMKEETFQIHLKPILKMLTEDKIILFFRNESALKTSNKSIFLYNDPDEIIERKNIYFDYIKENIITEFIKLGIIPEPKEADYSNPKGLAETVLKFMDANFGDQKIIVEEFIILDSYLESYKKELVLKELNEQIKEILIYIENSGKLCKIKNLRINEQPLSKDVVAALMANSSLLNIEHEDNSSYHTYLLHKNCIKEAIYLAKRLYEETGNDIEIRILSRMHIMDFIDDVQKKNFHESETISLFKYLNIFIKIWRSLFGNKHVSEIEAAKLKSSIDIEQKKRIALTKAREIDEETAKRVEAKMKDQKEVSTTVSTGTEKKVKKDPKDEKKNKALLTKISSILDSAWDREIYPDREFLHSSFDEPMTEEELLDLLKKNFSKDILSFQIKTATKPPKYKWPILVTKDYLKKKGKDILEKAKREHDREKSAVVPNQERFDLYSSLEEFLQRTMNKI